MAERDDTGFTGGGDRGAHLVDGTVRRATGPWTPAVHALLHHLASHGFRGAPRVLGIDAHGREVLTHLRGLTVADARPWPDWTHSEQALHEVGRWLRRYHDAVAGFVPADDAAWREGGRWQTGLVIGHNDAAPYNAVWDEGLVGFVDWDMAGPVTRESDVAWVAFAWVPLHARAVVEAEGFTDFAGRRGRLETFLGAYGWDGSVDEVLAHLTERLTAQVAVLQARAADDPTYARMLAAGRDRDLLAAREGLGEV